MIVTILTPGGHPVKYRCLSGVSESKRDQQFNSIIAATWHTSWHMLWHMLWHTLWHTQ